MNRLGHETSPYLRQHQNNPVDWYPWGDEAFARAKAEDKPILLSVGYSACHWCHVMAHESFENQEIAAVMNRGFVNIKVDREERPDVDAVYMEAVQAINGNGGWPMTVFLTPGGEPFFGGTYFPPQRRGGMPSFPEVLAAVTDAWDNRRDEVLDQAGQLAEAIRARTEVPGAGAGELTREILERAYGSLRAIHDNDLGGFGRAPKFPQPAMVDFLVRAAARNGSADSLRMLTTTLDAMASGGIYDHLGGGFARYSVDPYWLVPHFEKMLYDQAGLLRVYVHAWQVTGESRWRQVSEEIVTYVLRDLRAREGGLYSAEDADSEGEEGRFYVWDRDEIERVVGPELAAAAVDWYGVTAEGNFEGRNILHRPRRGDLLRPAAVEEARRLLFEHRSATRVRPGLDDKVLTEWNAMFLSALCEAAAATGRDDWLAAAVELAEFLCRELRRPEDGRWLRSWQDGRARHLAYAADYAWLVDAFVRLTELTGQARWLEAARQAADDLIELFWDDERGGLFTTGDDGERLVVRTKDVVDGAVPAANSVAAVALVRLAEMTGEDRYRSRAGAILALLAEPLAQQPTAFCHALSAVDLLVEGATEIVIAGDRDDLVRAARSRYLPNAVLAWGEPWKAPIWEGREPGRAYVCRNFACLLPATSVEQLDEQLGRPHG